ncbi:MAG: hypothetical protein B7Y88_04640 [Sphingomonadales bacterium 32-64-17]|nr:MAG: hypothetical protein B7Y88_04640 [Sphingomonadales bacterium 32-64-17]
MTQNAFTAPPFKRTRIVGIDLARSIAILLAMASHVWVVAYLGEFYRGAWVTALRVAMASATPTFIVLFGTMLEIVYLPRFGPGARRATSTRLLSRAAQCWLLYCLSVVVLFLTRDDYSAKFSIATILMLGVTPFTDILKFYVVVLAIAPILIWARQRFGLVALTVGAIAIHLLYPLFISLPTPAGSNMPIEVGRLWKFLFGLGEAQLGGPSIMRGITLVLAGMVIGKFLIGPNKAQPRSEDIRHKATLLLLGAGIPVSLLFIMLDHETVRSLGNLSLRIAEHPLYFLVGVLCASVLTAASVLLTTAVWTDREWRVLAFFGRTSLFTFAFGNILLYCVVIKPQSSGSALGLATALMIAIIALSFWFDWAMRKIGWLASIVNGTQRIITSLCEELYGRFTTTSAS